MDNNIGINLEINFFEDVRPEQRLVIIDVVRSRIIGRQFNSKAEAYKALQAIVEEYSTCHTAINHK